MTVTIPPRPPRPDDLRDRSEVEALGEQALIEEARKRGRQRRQRYAVVALAAAAAALAVGFGAISFVGRGAGSHPAAASASDSSRAGTAPVVNGKIAFADGMGTLQVVDQDGSGADVIMQCPAAMPDCELLEPTWSPAGGSIAFVRGSLRWPKGPIASRSSP